MLLKLVYSTYVCTRIESTLVYIELIIVYIYIWIELILVYIYKDRIDPCIYIQG